MLEYIQRTDAQTQSFYKQTLENLPRFPFDLKSLLSTGATISPVGLGAWRLQVPPGGGDYRLAQLDDYHNRRRPAFPHRAPLRLALRARAGRREIPGTWGFGLWNDPFGMSITLTKLRLPALPNTAWFFFASPPNHLALRDDLPGHGATAGAFRAPRVPAPLLGLSAPALALLAFPPAARLLRRLARPIVRQSAAALSLDPTDWHAYRIDWLPNRARFFVDDDLVLDTSLSPNGPLGVVLWVDNQYMAFPPDGRVRFGVLDSPQADWIEIADLHFE
jgi:hypothetical protein